jgi:mannose-1-phosphate guanylyltransferase
VSLPPALVLAAGLGTRLQPLSSLRAKPALPVAGEPLVRRTLRWLAGHGVCDVIVNLHHRPETVTGVVGDGGDLGLNVRYSWENPVLGSGGGPCRAFSLVETDELLLVNGDTLVDIDARALCLAHRASGALVTMALVENPAPERYGGVALDDERVTGFTRRGSDNSGRLFVGVQVATRRAFEAARNGEPSESVGALYPALLRTQPGSVRGWVTRGTFHDIGTPWQYLQTCVALADAHPGQLVDPTAAVSASARVSRSVVWEQAVIGGDVELTECVVADRVVVPAGSRYYRCALLQAQRVDGAQGGTVRDGLLAVPLLPDA